MRHKWILFLLLFPSFACATQIPKTLSESSQKYRTVRTVFDRLARVGSRVPPRLHILKADDRDNKLFISLGIDKFTRIRVNVEEKFVAIDEDLVDLMDSLGSERDNALAFLLGHELAHYAASESSGFAADRSTAMLQAICAGQKEKKQREICITKLNQNGMADKMEREARADRLGSWYAVEAGYEPFPAAERAIRTIYKQYSPDSGPSGYPAMEERITIVNQVRDYLADKKPYFDAATLLVTLGRYHEASRLFEFLARDFQSRELLNNAGVANTLAALSIGPRPKYHYPLELETAYRYPARTKEFYENWEIARRNLLTKAADQFDWALRIDPEYATAHMNRATVALLLGTEEELDFHLRKARSQAKSVRDELLLARLQILEGINLADHGKTVEAASLFTQARSKAESMAVSNLLAIDENPNLPPRQFFPDNKVDESVATLRPADMIHKTSEKHSNDLKDQYDSPIKLTFYTAAKWHGAKLQVGTLNVSTISTPANYVIASKRGVKIGDNEGSVTGRYGRPNRIIATRSGSNLIYEQDSIFFSIDRVGTVAGWTVYSVEEP